jgi:hypothetical protein
MSHCAEPRGPPRLLTDLTDRTVIDVTRARARNAANEVICQMCQDDFAILAGATVWRGAERSGNGHGGVAMRALTWTPALVEERLAEAADVLKRLPEPRVQGYYVLRPRIVHELGDLVRQEPPRHARLAPTPDAISRMDETLTWTIGLAPIDAKIVWLRAAGERWKVICWKAGLARAAAHEHWRYALCVIALRLNGRQPPRRASKRRLIAETYGATAREGADADTFRADRMGENRYVHR